MALLGVNCGASQIIILNVSRCMFHFASRVRNFHIHGIPYRSQKNLGKKQSECEIKNYSNTSLQELELQYPKYLISSKKQPDYVYLVDDKVAKDLAKHVCGDNANHRFILEANPGPGILTKSILEAGATRLRVFEKRSEFIPNLQALSRQFHGCLDIVEEDILQLPRLASKDYFTNQNVVGKLFQDIQVCSWTDAPCFKFVAVVSNQKQVNFVRYLLAMLPTLSSVFTYGRCQFFLFLPGKEYMYMTSKPKENYHSYRCVTVLYNLFFEIEFLNKIPLASFLPEQQPRSGKRWKYDTSHFHLVQLTPRADLFEKVAPIERLPDVYFFIKRHLIKRKSLVIPTLEQWIPNCGPRLIKEGLTVFARFGDLSPLEILHVFQHFASWPEYPDSVFHDAVARYYHCTNSIDTQLSIDDK